MSKDYNDGLDIAASIVEEMLGNTPEGETILCGIESSKKATTESRTYYFDFTDKGFDVHPDLESMIAFLLDESILFVGNDYGDGTVNLYININDYFAPAADAENLPTCDIPKLFEMYRKDGYAGVAQYVADKRGIPNKRWRDN